MSRGRKVFSAIRRTAEISQPRDGYSAAIRWARAYSTSASSATGSIGVKSRCAIHSARVNLVMWLEQAQNVTYTILRGYGVMLGGEACTRLPWNISTEPGLPVGATMPAPYAVSASAHSRVTVSLSSVQSG